MVGVNSALGSCSVQQLSLIVFDKCPGDRIECSESGQKKTVLQNRALSQLPARSNGDSSLGVTPLRSCKSIWSSSGCKAAGFFSDGSCKAVSLVFTATMELKEEDGITVK